MLKSTAATPDERASAVRALGELGDGAAVPTLAWLLDRPTYAYLRLPIMEALAKLGDARAMAPLLGCLEDVTTEPGDAFRRTLAAIAAVGGDRAVAGLVEYAATRGEALSHERAGDLASTLAQTRDPRVFDSLAALLRGRHHGDLAATTSIAAALADLGDHRAVPLLAAELQRCIASDYGGNGPLRSRIEALAQAVASFGDPAAVPVLTELLGQDKLRGWAGETATRALARIPDVRALDAVDRFVGHDEAKGLVARFARRPRLEPRLKAIKEQADATRREMHRGDRADPGIR